MKQGTDPHYVSSGHLLFMRAGVLLAVPFDPEKLETRGAAVPVVENVLENPRIGAGQYAVSKDGLLVYIPGGVTYGEHEMVFVDKAGNAKPLTANKRPYEDFTLSPDGKFLAITIEGPVTNTWVHDIARDTETRFNFGIENRDPRLAEGQLMTPPMLVDLLGRLGRSIPVEILPERVLVRTAEMIVWWSPTVERTMFFSDRGDDPAMKAINGKRFPHPPLLYKARGSHLWVRALVENIRPSADTRMCMAPYWNCYDNGAVCTGSMQIPNEKSVTAIAAWERSFFLSEFNHDSGTRKRTRFPGGLLAMWQFLAGKKEFPSRYLVKLPQTLAEFVNDNDHTYRNEPEPRN